MLEAPRAALGTGVLLKTIRDRWSAAHEKIEAAARRSGRSGKDIAVVAVTKGVGPKAIFEAVEAGLKIFGENRVQDAMAKIPEVMAKLEWHMIGHLQSNKTKDALELFSVIQSVDSLRLAERIQRECEAAGVDRVAPIFLEINISGQGQKYGLKPEEVYGVLDEMGPLSRVKITGLMGIAPNHGASPEAKRQAFKKLRQLFSVCKSLKRENVEIRHLSMGMTDDYEIAIEEGSNMIRLGRALFGDE
ncbi:MAG: YggS family pyridoxal phosphate-dependent enzyme [Candidatus Omnitrophica bacterium]|nr:YggS family pyridoxal phosphate-dependent enzyme [Candidatus Omnitrophota bacterium]